MNVKKTKVMIISKELIGKTVVINLMTKRTLLINIKSRKLKYYGHIKRKENILTNAMEGRVEEKLPQGRPRRIWFSDNSTQG